MFKVIWEDIFSPYSSLGMRFLSVLLLLFILALFCLLGLLGFIAVDTFGVQGTNSTMTVVEVKRVKPPYTTTVLVGKVPVPQYHPTSYWLHFKVEGHIVETTVEKHFFDGVKVGSTIKVDYGLTRLSGAYKPTHIAFAE